MQCTGVCNAVFVQCGVCSVLCAQWCVCTVGLMVSCVSAVWYVQYLCALWNVHACDVSITEYVPWCEVVNWYKVA